MTDDIQSVREDLEYTFRYMDNKTYQDRAHEYLTEYGLARSGQDTAVQCCVADLVRRAYECGIEAAADGGRQVEVGIMGKQVAACAELVDAALGMLRSAGRILE